MPTGVPAHSSLDHIYGSLAALNSLLKRQVDLQRAQMDASVRDDLLGLFITDVEVDEVLESITSGERKRGSGTGPLAAASVADGSRLAELGRLFGLSGFELCVVVLCLAPAIDIRYERIYGYLHNDVTRKRASVHLALTLFCDGPDASAKARAAFHPASPLRREKILQTATEGHHGLPPPLLSTQLSLDERIVSFLLDLDTIDPALDGVTITTPEPGALQVSLTEPDRTWIEDLSRLGESSGDALVLCLASDDEHMKRGVARYLAGARGVPLVEVELHRTPPGDAARDVIARAFREARLRNGRVYAGGVDTLYAADPDAVRYLVETAGNAPYTTILSSKVPWEQIRPEWIEGVTVLSRVLVAPGVHARALDWERYISGIDERAAYELASRYRLTTNQIANAAREARGQAALRHGEGPDQDDLMQAARAQSSHALGRLATRLDPVHSWDDLVVPVAVREQLGSIERHLRHRHMVLQQWGLGRRMGQGMGVTALFAGPSGTGKTMAAGVIARSLHLDIYRIDLSAVVSKYIGETEKNLSQVFREAEDANAVLFFDEADALFGKRSDVKDAHDRYANIEVAYLLQRMESFDGLAILGTNLRENLDAAFARRLQFIITFPFPEAPERERIWKRMLPDSAPLEPDLDFTHLATYPLAGGNIRNCVLSAAFMAADTGSAIGMEHLIHAIAAELKKVGRPVLQSEFGDYYRFANGSSPSSVTGDSHEHP